MAKIAWLGCGGCISAMRVGECEWKPHYIVDEIIKRTKQDYSEKAKNVEIIPIDVFSEHMKGEDMNFSNYKKVAERTLPFLKDTEIDGVVISMGSDTIQYAAMYYAIAFGRTLNKPIALVHAMTYMRDKNYKKHKLEDTKVVGKFISDGIETAAYSGIKEVVVCTAGEQTHGGKFTFTNILRGSRAVEYRPTRLDCFETPNEPPIAILKDSIFEYDPNYEFYISGKEPSLNTNFNKNILLIPVDCFLDKATAETINLANNVAGIIISSYHDDGTFIGCKETAKALICKAIDEIPVGVAPSQSGRVTLSKNENDRKLKCFGITPLGDMPSQKAAVKMSWALGQEKDPERVKKIMQTSYAGEITPGSYESGYAESKSININFSVLSF